MKVFAGTAGVFLTILAVGCAPPPAPPPTTPPPPVAGTAKRPPLADRPKPISASAAPARAAASADSSDVIARVGTKVITKDQLLDPMIDAHGLSFLLHIVQLELAKQATAEKGIIVTDADVKHERDLTYQRMFKQKRDDALRDKLKEAIEKGDNDAAEKIKTELNVNPDALLDQYLAQQFVQSRQYVSRQEFDIVLATNAHLRKIAEATPELKNALTEETLQKAFAAQYGEKIVIRHIQCANIAAITEAQRRLRAGESFGEVAKELSTNKNTAPLGGAVPPFTMNATNVPQVFKDTAFALKNGEVSDTVQSNNAYHLIKVENRIAPKVVKYENVKDTIRADLYDKILQAAVKQLRDKLAGQVISMLEVEHPALRAQFERRMEENKVRQAQIDEAMKRDRNTTMPPAEATDLTPPPLVEPATRATPANPVKPVPKAPPAK